MKIRVWQNSKNNNNKTQALRIIDSTCSTIHGNCRGADRGKRKIPLEVNSVKLSINKILHFKYNFAIFG